jgi:hypothetical protein
MVVVLGDVEVPGVLCRVAIAVADERRLPVIVQVCVGDGNPFGCVSNIHKTIIVVLIVIKI